MRKIFIFLATMMFSVAITKAQCPLTTAVDFTATDCHGQSFNLFEVLDQGKYVLIDFFFTTCGPCQTATPHIAGAYYEVGCNEKDVVFIEISPSDNNDACNAWVTQYGIEYPTIGRDGNGADICNTYGISAYPTVILIAPDRSIVENDIWPISSTSGFVNQLITHGITKFQCTTSVDETTVSEISVYPNPATDFLKIDIPNSMNNSNLEIYDATGRLIYQEIITGNHFISTTDFPKGLYVLKIGSEVRKFIKN